MSETNKQMINCSQRPDIHSTAPSASPLGCELCTLFSHRSSRTAHISSAAGEACGQISVPFPGIHDRMCLDGGQSTPHCHAGVSLCIKEHVATPSLSSSCEYRTRQFFIQPKTQKTLRWPQRMFMLFWRYIRSTPSPCLWLIGVLVRLALSCGPKQTDLTCMARSVYVDHTHGADSVLCCRLWTCFRTKGCLLCHLTLLC